jgi:phospho-N-acetylmuramoyl-pentapeptide-transferase
VKGILLSGALAAIFAFFTTPILIKFLSKKGYGQIIRADGPTAHHVKRGTPTMGGISLITAAILGYFSSHLLTGVPATTSALLVLGLIVGLGCIGFLDDWLKVAKQKSTGLNAKQKLVGQALIAGSFAYAGLQFPDKNGLTPISLSLSTVRDTSIKLGTLLVIIWVILMVLGTSNGVNLTDGLDGLATGAAVMVFTSFILIGVWEFGQSCAVTGGLKCYQVRDPLDLAVLAAALAGASGGFLWWNASPAKIFMGDVGSLALGGALAGIAITLRTQLLLVVLGFIFVLITSSVILQVAYFRISGGKRIFKMAPLQHHFELMGWGEVTIVIRFWIIASLGVAAGLGLFYAQWVVS